MTDNLDHANDFERAVAAWFEGAYSEGMKASGRDWRAVASQYPVYAAEIRRGMLAALRELANQQLEAEKYENLPAGKLYDMAIRREWLDELIRQGEADPLRQGSEGQEESPPAG